MQKSVVTLFVINKTVVTVTFTFKYKKPGENTFVGTLSGFNAKLTADTSLGWEYINQTRAFA